jgi:hypothetical protein
MLQSQIQGPRTNHYGMTRLRSRWSLPTKRWQDFIAPLASRLPDQAALTCQYLVSAEADCLLRRTRWRIQGEFSWCNPPSCRFTWPPHHAPWLVCSSSSEVDSLSDAATGRTKRWSQAKFLSVMPNQTLGHCYLRQNASRHVRKRQHGRCDDLCWTRRGLSC